MMLRNMARVALMASVTAVLSWIAVDLPWSPVPVTAQTLGVMLSGLLLEPREAALSQVVYLLAGALGMPVFSGGRSGAGMILGPTGGYLVGFVPGAAVCSLVARLALRMGPGGKLGRAAAGALGAAVGGIVVVDMLGVARLAQVARIGLAQAVSVGVIPYLPGDVLKCIAAAGVWMRLGAEGWPVKPGGPGGAGNEPGRRERMSP
jgi:biotin transport system substrate-specific component